MEDGGGGIVAEGANLEVPVDVAAVWKADVCFEGSGDVDCLGDSLAFRAKDLSWLVHVKQ